MHLLGDAPHQRLLMQRNVRDLVVNDAERFRDHVVAFLGIDFAEDLTGQFLDRLAATATQIALPALTLLVPPADDVGEDVPETERTGYPAPRVKRGAVP